MEGVKLLERRVLPAPCLFFARNANISVCLHFATKFGGRTMALREIKSLYSVYFTIRTYTERLSSTGTRGERRLPCQWSGGRFIRRDGRDWSLPLSVVEPRLPAVEPAIEEGKAS